MALLGPLIGGGVSLFNAILNANQQKRATDLGYLNLYETRRSNRAQLGEQRRVNDLVEALNKASREDALGNVTRYDEGLNAFVSDLTPMTEATLGAQENELLRQLREDAPRNRAAAVRRDRRSQLAEDAFEDLFNEYRYRPQRSEAADISDATNELLSARRKGLKQAQGDLARTVLRQGAGQQGLESVASAIGEQYGDTLSDAILEGKRVGRQRNREREGAEASQYLTELGQLRGIADDTTTSPVGRSNANEELTNRADNALQSLMAAIQSGGSRVASLIGEGAGRESAAMADLASSISRGGLDLSGVASALSGLSYDPEDPDQQRQEELRTQILELQLAKAMGQVGGQRDPSAGVYDPWAGMREVTRRY